MFDSVAMCAEIERNSKLMSKMNGLNLATTTTTSLDVVVVINFSQIITRANQCQTSNNLGVNQGLTWSKPQADPNHG